MPARDPPRSVHRHSVPIAGPPWQMPKRSQRCVRPLAAGQWPRWATSVARSDGVTGGCGMPPPVHEHDRLQQGRSSGSVRWLRPANGPRWLVQCVSCPRVLRRFAPCGHSARNRAHGPPHTSLPVRRWPLVPAPSVPHCKQRARSRRGGAWWGASSWAVRKGRSMAAFVVLVSLPRCVNRLPGLF